MPIPNRWKKCNLQITCGLELVDLWALARELDKQVRRRARLAGVNLSTARRLRGIRRGHAGGRSPFKSPAERLITRALGNLTRALIEKDAARFGWSAREAQEHAAAFIAARVAARESGQTSTETPARRAPEQTPDLIRNRPPVDPLNWQP